MGHRAIILAGGLGTRLRSKVADAPKVLAPVAGRPFLEHVLDNLAAGGFTSVVLAVGYMSAMVVEHFGSTYRGIELSYSFEETPLGTGGAIKKALECVPDGPVFVLNGDTFVEVDYGAMSAAHERSNATITIAVRRVDDVARYGRIDVAQGRVAAFEEKGGHGAGFINAGVYLCSAGVFEGYGLPESFSMEKEFLEAHLESLRPAVFELDGAFIDIGIPEDYERAQKIFA